MIFHFKLFALFLLFGLIAGQPPRPNGRDRAFLTPLAPPGSDESDSPRTEASASEGTDGPTATPESTETPTPSPSPSPCRRLRIRPVSGRCTHKFDGTLGEARRAHFSYFDVDSREMAGSGLKSARVISNLVSNQEGNIFNSRNLNELLVFFGQFLDHNVAATPLGEEHVDIEPPAGSEEEFPFRRSVRVGTGEGDTERPLNILSSVFDLVAVYGPNELRNQALRVPNSCKLKTSEGDLLPFNTEGFSNAPTTSAEFYFAGDQRSNEHPVLTAMHTLWVREHNYICDRIRVKLPFFSPDRLYEAARSICVAEFQKIVYEEFFPAITGRFLPRYRGFRRRANPTLSSLFSTAAFRVGHTMIGEVLTRIDEDGTSIATPLRDNFFIAESVKDGIEPFIRGVAQTKAQEIDLKVVDSLRNFLFQDIEEEEGPDLIALNLQRSRDHNMPSFNEVRREFRIRRARRFSDISSDFETQSRLSAAYDSVDDVEPWVGMMAEDKMASSSMGPTLFEVWRREFLRLRTGDQFFYLGRKAIARVVRRNCPELTLPIRNQGVRIFRDIILRNTDMSEDDLNAENVFQVPQ